MPNIFIYERKNSKPHTKQYEAQEETDDLWDRLLSDPKTPPKKTSLEAWKDGSPSVVGLEPSADAKTRSQGVAVHALVMDVDMWREDRPPFSLEEIIERLSAYRFIVWSSFSSTAEKRRWRLVLPLSSPMDSRYYSSLWDMVNEALDETVSKAQCHPDRLGFFGRIGDPSAYQYYINRAPRLNPDDFELKPEVRLSRQELPYERPDLPKEYLNEKEALDGALSYFSAVGLGLKDGEGRRETLLISLCKAFWEWGLDPDGVNKVAEVINKNFTEPKTEQEIDETLFQAYERTLGSRRIEQERSFAWRRAPTLPFSKANLKEIADSLKKRSAPQEKAIGRAINNIFKGNVICEITERVPLIEDAILRIGEVFHRTDAEKILFELRDSIAATRKESNDNIPSDERILALILRGQKRGETKVSVKEEKNEEEKKEKIRSAFLHIGEVRDTPYTEAEIKGFIKNCNLAEDRWILQKLKNYYMFIGGRYIGPYSVEEAHTMYVKILAPAEDILKLYYFDRDGKIAARKFYDVMREYGTVIDHVVLDMVCAESSFEERNNTLIKSVNNKMKIRARYSDEVDLFFRELTNYDEERYQDLLDYLSDFPDLGKPCPALCLVGKSGTGKQTMISGLTRIFKEHSPLSYDTIHVGLPRTVVDCPVICISEDPSRNYQRISSKAMMRQFVSGNIHWTGESKWTPTTKISGHMRVIATDTTLNIASKLKDILVGEKVDKDNFKDKMLVIEIPDSCKMTKMQEKEFIDKEGIARHVLWLQSNHQKMQRTQPRQEQGEEERDEDSFVNKTHASVLDKNEICEWIYKWAIAKSAPKDCGVYCVDGKLYCHPTEIFKSWNKLPGVDPYMPPPKSLGRAIKSLSIKRTSIRVSHRQAPYSVRLMDLDAIQEWIESNDYDIDTLVKAIIERSAASDPEVNVRQTVNAEDPN